MTTELNEVRQLLQQIADWKLPETGKYYDAEQQHPMSYEMCYGSNGAREYIRNLAQDALSLLTASPEVKETHNSSGFQNRSLNDISKRAKCFAKRFKSAIPEPDYKAQRDFLLKAMEQLACLGNGDKYGNSEGNCIAIAAIKKCNNP